MDQLPSNASEQQSKARKPHPDFLPRVEITSFKDANNLVSATETSVSGPPDAKAEKGPAASRLYRTREPNHAGTVNHGDLELNTFPLQLLQSMWSSRVSRSGPCCCQNVGKHPKVPTGGRLLPAPCSQSHPGHWSQSPV